MAMKSGMMAAICLLGSGITVAGAVVLAAAGSGTQEEGTPSKKQSPAPAASQAREKAVSPPLNLDSPDELKKANERRLEAARRRLEAQRTYYNEGRITIDRLGEASRQLMLAETALATTKDQRVAAAKSHWDRANEVLLRETDQLSAGRSTIADVSEAQVALEEASVMYMEARQSRGPADVEVLKNRIETLENQLERVTNRLEKLELAQPPSPAEAPYQREAQVSDSSRGTGGQGGLIVCVHPLFAKLSSFAPRRNVLSRIARRHLFCERLNEVR